MALPGHHMSVAMVKWRCMNLTCHPRPDGQTNEEQGDKVTRAVGDTGQHRAPRRNSMSLYT